MEGSVRSGFSPTERESFKEGVDCYMRRDFAEASRHFVGLVSGRPADSRLRHNLLLTQFRGGGCLDVDTFNTDFVAVLQQVRDGYELASYERYQVSTAWLHSHEKQMNAQRSDFLILGKNLI
jgi:hypothetical protein